MELHLVLALVVIDILVSGWSNWRAHRRRMETLEHVKKPHSRYGPVI